MCTWLLLFGSLDSPRSLSRRLTEERFDMDDTTLIKETTPRLHRIEKVNLYDT